MFRKLRNTFLLLNLVTTTVMMLVAFTAIYVITATDIQRDIENELMRISGVERGPDGFLEPPPPAVLPGDGATNAPAAAVPGRPATPDEPRPEPAVDPGFDPRPDRSVSFSLVLDERGLVISTSSIFEPDDDLYEQAAAADLSRNDGSGQVRLDGTQWAFISRETRDATRVTFLDVSSQHAILTQLIYTSLMVSGAMLVIIFFLSKAFADRAIKPIRDAFDKQKHFVADASHELRTPVAVISSNVDVLLANPEDRIADHRKWLDYIKRESQRMSKLTNDLLYLATVDHSEEKAGHTAVDLSHLVESTVLSMEALFFEAGLTLSHSISPGLTTSGDAARLERVVVVLLENALKYSDDRGTVTVEMAKNHNTISLRVSNPGKGIEPEHLERIFDRFYKVDSARSREQDSYGLGLAIAREIVLQHKGTISARSEAGRATTLSVELPTL